MLFPKGTTLRKYNVCSVNLHPEDVPAPAKNSPPPSIKIPSPSTSTIRTCCDFQTAASGAE